MHVCRPAALWRAALAYGLAAAASKRGRASNDRDLQITSSHDTPLDSVPGVTTNGALIRRQVPGMAAVDGQLPVAPGVHSGEGDGRVAEDEGRRGARHASASTGARRRNRAQEGVVAVDKTHNAAV